MNKRAPSICMPLHCSSAGIKPDIYKPVVTTYDYDCPVSETGRTGQPGIGGPNKFNVRPQSASP